MARHKLHHPAASSQQPRGSSLQSQAPSSSIPSVRPPPHRVNRVPSQSQDTSNLGKQASCSDSMHSKRIHDPSRGLNLEEQMSYGNINAKTSSGIMRPTNSGAAAIPLHAGSQIAMTQALPTKKRSWKDVDDVEKLPLYSHHQENSESNEGPSPAASYRRTRTQTKRKPRQFSSSAEKAKYDKFNEITERSQDEESFMNQDEIYNEVMDGISKYVELLGQGSNLTKQKLHNTAMEMGTQELSQNLDAQNECIEVMAGMSKYVKGLGRSPKPAKQKLPNIIMDGETQEPPRNLQVQEECIEEVPDGISMHVKGLGQGSKFKQHLHNRISKRKTQELPENFVVQDEFIELRNGRSKYVKLLGQGPKSKQKLLNVEMDRGTQELPQNLVVQNEYIEATDEKSERVTGTGRRSRPTKQKSQIISVGRETEDLPQDEFIELRDGRSKYVKQLGRGPKSKQKLRNVEMERETQELPQNLLVQDECIEATDGISEYMTGLGQGSKPTTQKSRITSVGRETEDPPQHEFIESRDGRSKYVKQLGRGPKSKQKLHNAEMERLTHELPQNLVVQDECIEATDEISEYMTGLGQGSKATKQKSRIISVGREAEDLPQDKFIESRDGRSKYVKQLGRGPNSKQKLLNVEMERETQEPPQNLVVQDECNEGTDTISEHVTGPGRGSKPTKQKSRIISMGREAEDLSQNLVDQDEHIDSRQRENEEQAVTQAAKVPTSLAKHLEEMRMRQAQLEQQAKLLEEMLFFEAQLKKQAKRLEEMSNSQTQLKALFQRLLQ